MEMSLQVKFRHTVPDGLRVIVVRAVGEGEAERIAGLEGLDPGQLVAADQEIEELLL